MEKQACALVQAVKAFQDNLLHSKIIAVVPNIVFKDILVQQDFDRRRVVP